MRRLIALAVAAPLLAAAPAQADLLSGCFGAVVIVCGPRVTHPVDREGTGVPVCAGSCETYYVPGLTDDPVCVTWRDEAGNVTTRCSRVDL